MVSSEEFVKLIDNCAKETPLAQKIRDDELKLKIQWIFSYYLQKFDTSVLGFRLFDKISIESLYFIRFFSDSKSVYDF